jgi:hypothetical protein
MRMALRRICQAITICLTICYTDIIFASAFFTSFDYHAYVDTSYNYLTNKNIFTSNLLNRVFDTEPNGFTFQQLGFETSKLPDAGLGADIYLIGGTDANRIAPSGWNPYFGSQTLAMTPEKVYIQYAISRLKIRAGIVDTLVGFESDDPTANTNFSHSFLDYAIPGSNVGVRGIYAVNEKINIYAGLGNGMTTIRHPTQLTMLEYAIEYGIGSDASFAFHGLNGNNGVNTIDGNTDEEQIILGIPIGPKARFNLFDVIATYNVTKKLALAANADYFAQMKGEEPGGNKTGIVWKGLAGYITYAFNDKWQLAGRAEIFNDRNGFATGVQQTLRDATVTIQYKPREHITLRGETRRDISSVNAYFNNGYRGGNTDFQQSYALEGIYLFV